MYKEDDTKKKEETAELSEGADKQMTNMAELTVKMAEAFAPTGFTLQSAKVQTQVPFLLRGELREY